MRRASSCAYCLQGESLPNGQGPAKFPSSNLHSAVINILPKNSKFLIIEGVILFGSAGVHPDKWEEDRE